MLSLTAVSGLSVGDNTSSRSPPGGVHRLMSQPIGMYTNPSRRSLAGLAGVTDQTDGWAWARLSGPDMAAVLARLCPLDLRALPVGTSARTMLTHLPAIVIRTAPETLEIGVFRSMAGTLEHELSAAMRAVAARASLR